MMPWGRWSGMKSKSSRPTPRNVETGGHVAGHVTAELVAGDPAQLGEDGLAVMANVDIRKGRIEGDGLISIEDVIGDNYTSLQ
jgi:hypothetical protein